MSDASREAEGLHRSSIAESIAQTADLERSRAHCLEVLESLRSDERGASARLEASQASREVLTNLVDAHARRHTELERDIADVQAGRDAAHSEIRALRRGLARLHEEEQTSARALARLEIQNERARLSTAAARDRVERVSYKLTHEISDQPDPE